MAGNYKRIFDEGFSDVRIKWHRPTDLVDNWKYFSQVKQDNIFLYKIIATRGTKHRLLYIGMSATQRIEDRLYNKDHRAKQALMKEANKGWKLQCCLGEYVTTRNGSGIDLDWAIKHVKQVEKLLIICHSDLDSLTNRMSVNWFSSGAWLRVYNTGFTADGMKKEVAYGLFVRQS